MSADWLETLGDLFARLRAHASVAGLVRYGSDPGQGHTGDLDLFVLLYGSEPEVESLHFDVGGVPVDLNLLTLTRLETLEPDFAFPALALRGGAVLYDPSGRVGAALKRLEAGFDERRVEPLSAHDVAFMRHGHRHVLDKLRGRLASEPMLANLLLTTNIYWLLQSYFRLRQLPFEGEKKALVHFREHEPELYGLLETFYQAGDLRHKLDLAETITSLVLAPVGGAWRRGEVLAFGHENAQGDGDLAQQGRRVYRDLLGG